MTQQEIQALIDAKIAGQGSAVDVGGALPQILSGILELAQAGATKTVVEMVGSVVDGTLEEALAALTIDGEPATVEKLLSLDISQFVIKRVQKLGEPEVTHTQYYTPTFKSAAFIDNVCNTITICGGFSNPAIDGLMLADITLQLVDGTSTVYVYEL